MHVCYLLSGKGNWLPLQYLEMPEVDETLLSHDLDFILREFNLVCIYVFFQPEERQINCEAGNCKMRI